MRLVIGLVAVIALAAGTMSFAEDKPKQGNATSEEARSVYDFVVKDIDGKDVQLSKYKGDVLLIVNVASKCGLTDANYKGLEALNSNFKEKGLRILAFPANNFGEQEPGTNEQIKTFCRDEKKASFDLFSKISVKGEDIAPLYKYLTGNPDSKIGGEVRWNFQKYLVDRTGNIVKKFDPRVPADDPQISSAITAELEKNGENRG